MKATEESMCITELYRKQPMLKNSKFKLGLDKSFDMANVTFFFWFCSDILPNKGTA